LAMSLEDDLEPGDITSGLLLGRQRSKAIFVAKSGCVAAGLPFAREVFRLVDGETVFRPLAKEGFTVKKGGLLAEITGRTASLLAAERVSLNVIQHLCGIATLTRSYVDAIKGLSSRIVDTRKTMPSMRYMEKYAVRMGGGGNHRFGLYDGILIKDNHIKAAGGIKKAVELAKKGGMHHLLKIEIEVEDLKGVREALDAGADVIMLDNMSVPMMERAVKLCNKRVLIEASGNVTLENVRDIAQTGVDLISSGSITHSAPAADISMRIV
nr:carboxylating nicotinate-nucleotide diphosphorylase [Nitrospiraceae bacterium]